MNDATQRLAWALEVCRRAQMRPTQIRQKVLAILAAQRVPMSLDAVMQADSIRGCCNATTAYRTLMLFKELGVIRQVSLPNKVSYFVLNVPDESSHFLICRRCGQISELPESESVVALERAVAATRGYAQLHHELEFFGICPACQKQPAPVLSSKVPTRMPLTGHLKPVLAEAKPNPCAHPCSTSPG